MMRVKLEKSVCASGETVGVLLIHGLCGSPSEMQFVANGLARAGYDCLCPVLAGHGGSPRDLTATHWQDWYATAERDLFRLRQQCDRVFVAGLSTGALLALMLAARHRALIQGLALYSPTLWLNGRKMPKYVKLFRFVTSRRLAGLFQFSAPDDFGIKDERLRGLIKSTLSRSEQPLKTLSIPGIAALERQRLAAAVLKSIPAIKTPVLMMHPREDGYAALSNAAFLQQALAGPVDMVVLDDSYHLVTVDRQRELVLERTLAFLDASAQRTGKVRSAA